MQKKIKKNKKFLKLRYWREYLNKNQEDMAVLLGYGRANYCEKENGNTVFNLNEAVLILEEFNKELKIMGLPVLTLDELFSR